MNFPESKNPFRNGKLIGKNVSSAEYVTNQKRGEPGFVMSRSELCEFNACPSRWIRGYRGTGSKSTEWGSLIDCLVLTPEKFGEQFAITPATYPDSKTGDPKPWNWNANFCKDWKAERPGKQIVTPDEYADAEAAVLRIKNDEDIAEYIQCSDKQVFVTAEYHDADTGLVIPVKALLDLVPSKNHQQYGKTLADFKTARSADARDWQKQVFEHDYHIQGAFHTDIYVAATGEDRCDFRHIVQENFPPYETAKRLLSAEFLDFGRACYIEALKRYARCLADNNWPGYDEESNDRIQGWKLVNPEAWMIQKAA